jgi:hypothetical protein
METLRFLVGGGLLGLLVTSLFKPSFSKQTFFALSNIGAVLLCLCVLAIAYHSGSYNLTSRYLIAPYIFLIILSIEGFYEVFKRIFCSNLALDAMPSFIILFGIAIQSSAWMITINRYL